MSEQTSEKTPLSHYTRPPEEYKSSHHDFRAANSSFSLFHFSDIVQYKTNTNGRTMTYTGMVIEQCVKQPNVYLILVNKKILNALKKVERLVNKFKFFYYKSFQLFQLFQKVVFY